MEPLQTHSQSPGSVIRLKHASDGSSLSAPMSPIPRSITTQTNLKFAPVTAKPASSDKPSWFVMIGIVVVLIMGVGLYYVVEGSGAVLRGNVVSAPSADPQRVIAELGKIILLPAGETPTIATVSDMSKLQGQAFFANAVQGDLVIMYAHARLAILYRASEHKIIQVAPITDTQ